MIRGSFPALFRSSGRIRILPLSSSSSASSISPIVPLFSSSSFSPFSSSSSSTVSSSHLSSFRPLFSSLPSSSLLSPNPFGLNLVRFLNLHEYQSKSLMSKHGVRVQRGEVASTPEEAERISIKLQQTGAKELVIKAQIHAGGRGKGHFSNGFKGGVKVTTSPAEIKSYAKSFLGNSLITKQTGPEGQPVRKVLVHEGISFDKEYYFAILMDRAHNGPVLVASPEGGMDIEEVAEHSPHKIFTEPIDVIKGITDKNTKRIGELLGFKGQKLIDAQNQMSSLYKLFITEEATQVEINPLVETKEGLVFCVDAKILFDDNAAFRHEELQKMRDTSMEDQREVAASEYNLNYIGLDGNIGCMVNGAGLAMATMDIIKIKGGAPANFLDVGGSASEKQVEEAFKILTRDPKVKCLLINIFGGIMKCDTIANGIVNAAKTVGLKVPLVVRLEGTNVEKGVEILNQSGIKLHTARNLDQAAELAVKSLSQSK